MIVLEACSCISKHPHLNDFLLEYSLSVSSGIILEFWVYRRECLKGVQRQAAVATVRVCFYLFPFRAEAVCSKSLTRRNACWSF